MAIDMVRRPDIHLSISPIKLLPDVASRPVFHDRVRSKEEKGEMLYTPPLVCQQDGQTFNTPNSLPTLMKAAIHLSSCSFVCPAESCTRMRAWSFGTTG